MEQHTRHPFDLIDLGLLLFVAPLHPVAFFAVLGQWFIRRSSGIAASAADTLAAIGVDRRLAEGRLARALLPGLAKRPGGQPEPPLLPDWGDPLTPPSPAAAGAGGWGGEGLSALPMITVAELAAGDNLLIVGSRGSGKTTLLQAILANRQRRCYILDPHSHPGKWPSNAKVLGGGRDFATIYAALLRGEDELTKRAQALNTNAQARFAPFTLASDEWGSVTSEIVVGKDQDPPGRLMIRLLKEGRKFGISFIGCAHGDTAESLGSKGDTAAFRASFDWIVYCGAFVGRELRDIPELARSLPLGRTPEGGTFPLIVVAISPITGARRLLDLRGIGQGLGADRKSVSWSHSPHQQRIAPPRPPQRERGLGGEGVQAPPNDRTDEPTTSALRTREDLVRALLAAGWGVTQIRDTLKGTNSEIGALVRQIEDEQLHQGRS